MLLHTINKAPPSSSALASCLRAAAPGSVLLLIEDGVYAATLELAHRSGLSARDDLRRCVLAPDVAARGLKDLLAPELELVDYAGFVRLSTECHAVQSWY